MQNELLLEIYEKYGEWLEHAGENAPALFYHILATIIINERQNNEYLKKRLNNEGIGSTK
ncbi:MAG: hypothetical protein AABY22_10475 [Nanoarchaeota archaeon]